MSRITVKLDDPKDQPPVPANYHSNVSGRSPEAGKKRGSRLGRIIKILLTLAVIVLVIGGVAGYFYWQNFRRTPAYSMALIIDAAQRDDKETLAKLVDSDKVVDAFVPQITDKAVELYGRNLPQSVLQRLARVASPVLPALKERARAELPRLIREKTSRVENVPFVFVALGASQALDIKQEGDIAWVKSTMADRPLELKMQRNGDLWQIVEIRDEPLARTIAETVGQEIISAAGGGVNKAGQALGIPNLNELLKRAEEAFRQTPQQ